MIYFQTLDYYDHEINSLIQLQKVSSFPPRVSKLIFRQSRKTLLHFKYLKQALSHFCVYPEILKSVAKKK